MTCLPNAEVTEIVTWRETICTVHLRHMSIAVYHITLSEHLARLGVVTKDLLMVITCSIRLADVVGHGEQARLARVL